MTIYIGVDIGLDGAISAIDENQNVIWSYPMPVIKGDRSNYDIQNIIKIFETNKEGNDLFVIVEKPIPRPIISCSSNFMLGAGQYLFEGILSSLYLRYQIVTAATWQKELLKGLSKDTKTASIMFCKRMWPNVDLRKTERSSKDHDGMADSLCIALYGYRLNKK